VRAAVERSWRSTPYDAREAKHTIGHPDALEVEVELAWVIINVVRDICVKELEITSSCEKWSKPTRNILSGVLEDRMVILKLIASQNATHAFTSQV
jgi:hypothetical protein